MQLVNFKQLGFPEKLLTQIDVGNFKNKLSSIHKKEHSQNNENGPLLLFLKTKNYKCT